ncbi:MAG: hypothetical protein WEB03_02355 [Nitriliruptor sp.]|uniref:hypothetical protein n=1 Tax=Nitriliruptor sp. TaxID=2448056 RepID=UPI0034A04596
MDAPAAVLAIVLATTAVGSSALVWASPTWGAVRHGYEILTGATVVLIAWGAWAAFGAPISTLDGTGQLGNGQLARTLLLAFTVLTALAVVALVVKVPPITARVLGLLATLAGLGSFVPLAAVRAGLAGGGGRDHGALPVGEVVLGVGELLAGAILMGAIWVGMILGHWYLVERRLTNRYMVQIAWVNVAAVGAGLVSVLLSARNPAPCADLSAGAAFQQCAQTFSPILRIGSMTIILGLGVLAIIALIAGFNVKLAREGGRSIQASTGMFYLAVILAPAVEFAAKVRFF